MGTLAFTGHFLHKNTLKIIFCDYIYVKILMFILYIKIFFSI